MKNLRKVFFLIAACMICAFGVSAQSMQEMGEQVMSEMVKALNAPETVQQMKKEAGLTQFNATSNGTTLIMNMTVADKSANFGILSAEEKAELTDSFSDTLISGIMEDGEDGEMILNAFKMLGIKVHINLKDQFGNTLSKTVDFK